MSNKKQSSVDWLISQLDKYYVLSFDDLKNNDAVQQAKAMHKEEIIKAYCTALPIEDGITIAINKGDDYYSKQYVDNNE